MVPVVPMAPPRASATMPTGTPSSEWWWELKGFSKAFRSGEYQQPTHTGKGAASDCRGVSVFRMIQAADTHQAFFKCYIQKSGHMLGFYLSLNLWFSVSPISDFLPGREDATFLVKEKKLSEAGKSLA